MPKKKIIVPRRLDAFERAIAAIDATLQKMDDDLMDKVGRPRRPQTFKMDADEVEAIEEMIAEAANPRPTRNRPEMPQKAMNKRGARGRKLH